MVDTELEINPKNSVHSSLRESIIEHLFVGGILKALWLENTTRVEVLKPQVDNAGYDLVIECSRSPENNHSIIRYIQLKTSHVGAKRSSVDVSMNLVHKPNWCVIWIFFNPDTLDLGPFLWFPRLGQPPPNMDQLQTTKHTRGNKADRPGLREVPKSQFEKLDTIKDVISRLFTKAPITGL